MNLFALCKIFETGNTVLISARECFNNAISKLSLNVKSSDILAR